MPLDKLDCVGFIADERVMPGAGRHVAEHIRVVAQQPVADAGGRHLALGIHHLLFVVLVDIAPPCLRMADEVYLREFLEHLVESFDAGVVVAVLEMH